jgi:hypothetical protein
MNSTLKFMLGASVAAFVSMPAQAANFNIAAISTGAGDYSFDVSDKATGKGTFTDTFTFTIPGTNIGVIDLGLLNVAAPKSSGNIDFISAFISGTPTNVPLTVVNAGSLSTVGNDSSIPVLAGATYVLHVTYTAAAKAALFNGNVSFSAAPEPAAWAMMLLGFGVVGASLRIRGRKPNMAVSYS